MCHDQFDEFKHFRYPTFNDQSFDRCQRRQGDNFKKVD